MGHRGTSRGYRETPLGTQRPSGSSTSPRGMCTEPQSLHCTCGTSTDLPAVGPPRCDPQPAAPQDPHGTPRAPSGSSMEGNPVGTPSGDSVTFWDPQQPTGIPCASYGGGPQTHRDTPEPHGDPTFPMETHGHPQCISSHVCLTYHPGDPHRCHWGPPSPLQPPTHGSH